MTWTLRLVTDATAEPVSVADLKTYLRLSTADTTEDTLLTALEKAARHAAENKTGRCCLAQTFQLLVDDWPANGEFILPRAPLSSTDTDVVITYLDPTSGNSTTLSTTVFGVDVYAEPGRVFLRDGQDWPDHYTQRNAITVQFQAGYPTSNATDTCPEDIETWIKMRVSQMYEFREPTITGTIVQELQRSFVDGLLDPYVLIDVRP